MADDRLVKICCSKVKDTRRKCIPQTWTHVVGKLYRAKAILGEDVRGIIFYCEQWKYFLCEVGGLNRNVKCA